MKKTLVKVLAGLLAVTGSLAAFGCGDRNDTPTEERPAQYTLADFENWAPDFQMCRISSTFGKVSMNTDPAYVRSGSRSARIDPVGSGWMYLPTYSENFGYDYADFTYVNSIRMEMYNAQDTEEIVNVGLVAATHGIDSFDRAGETTFTLRPGWNTVELYVEPSIVCIIADLTDVQGIYFTFDPVNVGSITEDTPRFYLDNVRLMTRETPHSTETNLQFAENEIIDFERFYHKYFLINDFGVDMGIVNAADYGISAASGSKVLRLVMPGTNTGGWNYYVQLMAPFLKAGALGQLTDEQFENAYFCWDAYNTSEAEYNVVAIFELGTGAKDYRVGSTPKKNRWTTFRVKLTDIEKNLEGWRDNMGLFVFSVKDEYDFDREIFFDNFRVEYGD